MIRAAREVVRAAAILAVLAAAARESRAIETEGAVELGLFIPYVAFDTNAPIIDHRGENDAIRDSFGRGIGGGYDFPRNNAAEFALYWVSTDSEDMHHRNHFSILTRYFTLGYRRNWSWKGVVDPFFSVGAGDFYANAMEVDHDSFGGRSYYAGVGLRYSPDSRSSVRVYLQEMHVDMEVQPHRANNVLFAVGGVFYLGGQQKGITH
jgi:outer membrane protein with beta-barrel domain